MNKKSLPMFGVGPIYVGTCLVLTIIGMVLKDCSFLKNGEFTKFKTVAMIIGLILILMGIVLWVYAVVIQKINVEAKKGKLVTKGVYAIVRNPVYSAFFLLFTGFLVMAHHLYLLVLPVIFYVFLSILMKQTEEKWLLETFGKEYQDYCARVNRIIPWFKKS